MKKYLVSALFLAAIFSLVGVAEAAGQPSVDLKVNNSNGTISVPNGTAVALSWSTQNVTSCTASGAWSGSRSTGSSEVTVPLSTGSYTYTLTCTDGSTLVSDEVTVNVGADQTAPLVDLKANNQDGPITVTSGTPVTLSWSTQNAVVCSASNGWTGSKSTGSSELVGTLSVSKTFTLTCTGPGGSASDSVTVNVQGVSAPSVDLKANNQEGTLTAVTGTPITLTWSTQNATSCTASGDWSGSKATGGSESVGAPTSDKTYTLTCTNASGSTSDTVNVHIVGLGLLFVDLKVNGQDASNVTVATSSQFTLSWTSAGVSSCTASGDWSGTKATSGSETMTASSDASVSKTFTLTCNNTTGGGTTSDTATVTTTGNVIPGGPLVITNLRITDITSSSVVVRWTTNRVANSRVLYDTASHSSISGQSAPNYGYANSTGTSDNDTKVIEHAVTVSGLSSNTTYYFRAISQE